MVFLKLDIVASIFQDGVLTTLKHSKRHYGMFRPYGF